MATKDELNNAVSKLATKDELNEVKNIVKGLPTKTDLDDSFDELARMVAVGFKENDEMYNGLKSELGDFRSEVRDRFEEVNTRLENSDIKINNVETKMGRTEYKFWAARRKRQLVSQS